MSVRAKDLYVASIPYGHSTDPRPCIVLEVLDSEHVSVVPVSSAHPLFNPSIHFSIPETHPDFRVTGLNRRSYADGTEIHAIHISKLIKFLGRLEGALAKEFDAWI